MFVGAVAESDRTAQRVVELVAQSLPNASGSFSVIGGVAIACWNGADLERSSFSGDYAHVGTLRGGVPGVGTELRGDFAIVARSSGHLRLARGRFAGRPLYWTRIGATTVACSRLLPLAVLAGQDARLNLDHVLSLFDLQFGPLCPPLPFLGVERVHANTLVDIDAAGHVRTHTGPLAFEQELALSTRDMASALRNEFEAAVARESTGAQRVAVMSGGGVDSSNLLGVAVGNARRHGTADVIPVALHFGGQGDDRPHLKAVCAHLGIEPLRVAPAEGAAYAADGRVVDGCAHTTAAQAAGLAMFHRAKLAGADRILVGDGSEWILDASPPVFADFLLSEPLRALRCARRFEAIYQTRRQSWRRMVLGPLLRRALPAFVLEGRATRVYRDKLTRSANTFGWAGERLRPLLTTLRKQPSLKPIQSQRARVTELASSTLLTWVREMYSRWEILVGLPISLPYLDDDFVRFVARIPSGAIFAGARERGLLRESMDGIVPDSVRYRMDKGRPDYSFAELFDAMGGQQAVGDLVSVRELESLGIVNSANFASAFDKHAADPFADPFCWRALWAAITAEAYLRWFNRFKAEMSSRTSLQSLETPAL